MTGMLTRRTLLGAVAAASLAPRKVAAPRSRPHRYCPCRFRDDRIERLLVAFILKSPETVEILSTFPGRSVRVFNQTIGLDDADRLYLIEHEKATAA